MIEKSWNCHNVQITESYCHTGFFSQKFRQMKFLLKKFTINWFDGKSVAFFSFFHTHSVEKWKIYSHRNFFRQINSLVIYLVNALLSRNFCQKSVRVNFRNFHTVECCTLWKFRKSFKIISQIFREISVISTLCNINNLLKSHSS